MTNEQDMRLDILNTLLTTPHRQLDKIWPIHEKLIGLDPLFYVRLAAWYADNGSVRDHKEMFVIALVLSNFEGHRDTGLALLRQMPPYQIGRIVDFIKGRKKTRSSAPKEKQAEMSKRQRQASARAALTGEQPKKDEPEGKYVHATGLFKNIPRAMKTEITRYLREREADANRFDSTVLHARKYLKRLYALLHIKPGPRAQAILFEDNPPADSRLGALKLLAACEKPAEQAVAIVENRIPYRVASSVIKQMTPTVLVALIDQMTPQEVINNMSSLRKRGALDSPDIKSLIEGKLEDAKTDSRVSALKASKAIEAADGLSADLKKSLEDVADQQIKSKGSITRPTALFVDKSGSMEIAIELGKQIGAMVSTICEADLFVYAFDTISYPIEPQGTDLADWERAFSGIRATGATSCGVSFLSLMKAKQYVDQVIIVTDEVHNTNPPFVSAYQQYCDAMSAAPSIQIVRTPGGADFVEKRCRDAAIDCDVFQFAGDYYSLPNLIPMLSSPSKLELLMDIMQYKLPQRKPA